LQLQAHLETEYVSGVTERNDLFSPLNTSLTVMGLTMGVEVETSSQAWSTLREKAPTH
jgi:hypothetical protein